MARYRKKPIVVEAHQWFQHGDHPKVDKKKTVVGMTCKQCKGTLSGHGWIKTLEGGHIVCPGDFIITGVQGEHYPCKPDIFAAIYEPVAGE